MDEVAAKHLSKMSKSQASSKG